MDLSGLAKPAQQVSASPLDESAAFQKGQVVTAKILGIVSPDQATLRIGQRIVQAVLNRMMEQGEEILLKVLETHPNLVFSALESEDGGAAPYKPFTFGQAGGPDQVSLDSLKKNSLLKFIVVGKTAPDLIRVQLFQPKNLNHPASDRPPGLTARLSESFLGDVCQPGRELFGQVVETSPKLILRLDRSPEKIGERPPSLPDSSNAAGTFEKLPDLAHQLRSLIETSTLPPGPLRERASELMAQLLDLSPLDEKPEADFLHRLLEAVGLKGQRSALQETVGKLLSAAIRPSGLESVHSDPATRELVETAIRLFQTVDLSATGRLENVLRNDALQFAFPIFWPTGPGRGDLRITGFDAHRRDPDGRPLHIVMILDLTRIGPVKIDVELFRQRLKVGLLTPNPQVRDIINRRRPDLIRSMAARGLTVEALTVSILPEFIPAASSEPSGPAVSEPRTIDIKV